MDYLSARRRRQMLMSAPALKTIPRVDSHVARQQLICPSRREATELLRREYILSKKSDLRSTSSNTNTEYDRIRKGIRTSHCNREQFPSFQRSKTLNETEWRKEITKVNLPERLPICVPVNITTPKIQVFLTDKYRTTNPLFYRACANKRPEGGSAKARMQYFINKDWSSERLSWVNFHKNVPEIHKLSWVC